MVLVFSHCRHVITEEYPLHHNTETVLLKPLRSEVTSSDLLRIPDQVMAMKSRSSMLHIELALQQNRWGVPIGCIKGCIQELCSAK